MPADYGMGRFKDMDSLLKAAPTFRDLYIRRKWADEYQQIGAEADLHMVLMQPGIYVYRGDRLDKLLLRRRLKASKRISNAHFADWTNERSERFDMTTEDPKAKTMMGAYRQLFI